MHLKNVASLGCHAYFDELATDQLCNIFTKFRLFCLNNKIEKKRNNVKKGWYYSLGARFSKYQETYRARKTIFSSCKMYTPKTSRMKGTSFHSARNVNKTAL